MNSKNYKEIKELNHVQKDISNFIKRGHVNRTEIQKDSKLFFKAINMKSSIRIFPWRNTPQVLITTSISINI